jgi:hypothetical protein
MTTLYTRTIQKFWILYKIQNLSGQSKSGKPGRDGGAERGVLVEEAQYTRMADARAMLHR